MQIRAYLCMYVCVYVFLYPYMYVCMYTLLCKVLRRSAVRFLKHLSLLKHLIESHSNGINIKLCKISYVERKFIRIILN